MSLDYPFLMVGFYLVLHTTSPIYIIMISLLRGMDTLAREATLAKIFSTLSSSALLKRERTVEVESFFTFKVNPFLKGFCL